MIPSKQGLVEKYIVVMHIGTPKIFRNMYTVYLCVLVPNDGILCCRLFLMTTS